MNILITGGSGFLGSALALHFAALGHEVFLPLRPSSTLKRLKGKEESLNIVRFRDDREFIECIKSSSPDVLIHTVCSYGRAGETSLNISDVNVRFGLLILDALNAIDKPVTFINTGTALDSSVSLYALSKNQFAEWARRYAMENNRFRFVNVLLQHMYGPGDDRAKFTSYVINACYEQKEELALTPGEQRRDFIYIDDIVAAYQMLVDKLDDFSNVEQVEVGSGSAPTVRQFVETVHALTKSKTLLKFGAVEYRKNEAMHCEANIGRLLALGWKPKFDINAGIKKTIELEFFR